MAKRKEKQKKIQLLIYLLIIIIAAILTISYTKLEDIDKENIIINKITAQESENVVLEENDILQIHFFDVGQADSILIISNQKTMLIDAGTNETGKIVVKNLQNLGIEKIDYLIGTHPHEDHIGGLDDVIKNFDIGTIYMPKVQTNTKTFEDVLDAIIEKNLQVESPNMGDKFILGNAECEIMLCENEIKEEQKKLNLSSIVVRITYKEQSYIFMGDAEKENENMRTWENTNVIKIGHHGSKTSTSQKFLNQIKPQIAIISVGKDNSYSHPHKETLDRLNKLGTLIYRTDEKGNILLESDGKNNKISFY